MRLNELLGTEFPFIQGGMANIATGEFAAAVSNAGALGLIGAGGMTVDTLRENIHKCRSLTDRPFGVNIMLMNPQAKEMAALVAEEQIPVITTGAGNPAPFLSMWKAAGAKVDALDCLALAEEAGSSKAVNIVLMGRLSHYFDLPDEAWQKSLEVCVPSKFLELNKKAFQLGKNA